MTDLPIPESLRAVLRRAALGTLLEDAWLFLPVRDPLTPDTHCILLSNEPLDDEGVPIRSPGNHGFPVEGLDSESLVATADWAKQFQNPPSDSLLLESFVYYLRYDAFLPQPGALPPPPDDEIQLDRDFYDGLGPERSGSRCGTHNCPRGTVAFSLFCRIHHFEMIQKRPCPFSH